jgi:hypothetical protein
MQLPSRLERYRLEYSTTGIARQSGKVRVQFRFWQPLTGWLPAYFGVLLFGNADALFYIYPYEQQAPDQEKDDQRQDAEAAFSS